MRRSPHAVVLSDCYHDFVRKNPKTFLPTTILKLIRSTFWRVAIQANSTEEATGQKTNFFSTIEDENIRRRAIENMMPGFFDERQCDVFDKDRPWLSLAQSLPYQPKILSVGDPSSNLDESGVVDVIDVPSSAKLFEADESTFEEIWRNLRKPGGGSSMSGTPNGLGNSLSNVKFENSIVVIGGTVENSKLLIQKIPQDDPTKIPLEKLTEELSKALSNFSGQAGESQEDMERLKGMAEITETVADPDTKPAVRSLSVEGLKQAALSVKEAFPAIFSAAKLVYETISGGSF